MTQKVCKIILLLLLFFSPVSQAQNKESLKSEDFYYNLKLPFLQGDPGKFFLPEHVYQNIQSSQLNDIRVFNANSEILRHVIERWDEESNYKKSFQSVDYLLLSQDDIKPAKSLQDRILLKIKRRGSSFYKKQNQILKNKKVVGVLFDFHEVDEEVLKIKFNVTALGIFKNAVFYKSEDLNVWEPVNPIKAVHFKNSYTKIVDKKRSDFVSPQVFHEQNGGETELIFKKAKYIQVRFKDDKLDDKNSIVSELSHAQVERKDFLQKKENHFFIKKDFTSKKTTNDQLHTEFIYDLGGFFPIESFSFSFEAESFRAKVYAFEDQKERKVYEGLIKDSKQKIAIDHKNLARLSHMKLVVPKSLENFSPKIVVKIQPDQLFVYKKGDGPYTVAYGYKNLPKADFSAALNTKNSYFEAKYGKMSGSSELIPIKMRDAPLDYIILKQNAKRRQNYQVWTFLLIGIWVLIGMTFALRKKIKTESKKL